MAEVERRADVVWEGDLVGGSGTVKSVTSGALSNLGVTWKARTEDAGGKTSPEELIAAAHAACYAMAFSHTLATGGHPPQRLEVSASVGFGPKPGGGMQITHSNLTVRGRVPGMGQAAFAEAARQGEQGCPVSNALRNNVEINLQAALDAG